AWARCWSWTMSPTPGPVFEICLASSEPPGRRGRWTRLITTGGSASCAGPPRKRLAPWTPARQNRRLRPSGAPMTLLAGAREVAHDTSDALTRPTRLRDGRAYTTDAPPTRARIDRRLLAQGAVTVR